MLGAIIGDIVGSRFEWNNHRDKDFEEAKLLSKLVTEVTHNHPEGIKGAEATAVAIYMAKTGSGIFEIMLPQFHRL